uniref:Uncharacterized protein n=1 Tax=Zea mays TaxID=4577 RepID=A0A804PXG3_MAIZE
MRTTYEASGERWANIHGITSAASVVDGGGRLSLTQHHASHPRRRRSCRPAHHIPQLFSVCGQGEEEITFFTMNTRAAVKIVALRLQLENKDREVERLKDLCLR